MTPKSAAVWIFWRKSYRFDLRVPDGYFESIEILEATTIEQHFYGKHPYKHVVYYLPYTTVYLVLRIAIKL